MLPANTVESLTAVGHAAKDLQGVAEWPSFRGQHPQVVDIIKQRFLHFRIMKKDNAKGGRWVCKLCPWTSQSTGCVRCIEHMTYHVKVRNEDIMKMVEEKDIAWTSQHK